VVYISGGGARPGKEEEGGRDREEMRSWHNVTGAEKPVYGNDMLHA
jgi:hypothetical protein